MSWKPIQGSSQASEDVIKLGTSRGLRPPGTSPEPQVLDQREGEGHTFPPPRPPGLWWYVSLHFNGAAPVMGSAHTIATIIINSEVSVINLCKLIAYHNNTRHLLWAVSHQWEIYYHYYQIYIFLYHFPSLQWSFPVGLKDPSPPTLPSLAWDLERKNKNKD